MGADRRGFVGHEPVRPGVHLDANLQPGPTG